MSISVLQDFLLYIAHLRLKNVSTLVCPMFWFWFPQLFLWTRNTPYETQCVKQNSLNKTYAFKSNRKIVLFYLQFNISWYIYQAHYNVVIFATNSFSKKSFRFAQSNSLKTFVKFLPPIIALDNSKYSSSRIRNKFI